HWIGPRRDSRELHVSPECARWSAGGAFRRHLGGRRSAHSTCLRWGASPLASSDPDRWVCRRRTGVLALPLPWRRLTPGSCSAEQHDIISMARPGGFLMQDDIVALFAYDRWANHKILDACRKLTAEQYVAEPGSGWSSVRSTIYHIAMATERNLLALAGASNESIP